MMGDTFMIINYSENYIDDDSTPDEKKVWPHLNRREVVGIMKTIMDNFKPVHIDIIKERKI